MTTIDRDVRIHESDPQLLRGSALAGAFASACSGEMPSEPYGSLRFRRILMPQMIGGELTWSVFGPLANAMRIRGAEVTALLCDQFLPACVHRKVDHHDLACTRWCGPNATDFASSLGLPHRFHSEFITPEEKHACARIAREADTRDLAGFEHRGIDLGSLVPISVESAFKVGEYDPENPAMRHKAAEFLLSGLYLVHIYERAFETLGTDKIVSDSGMHIDWGVPRAVARKHGIAVDVMNIGLRGSSVKLETDRPGDFDNLVPGWDRWREMPLTNEQESSLTEYLERRDLVPYEFKGEQWKGRENDPDAVRELIGLPEQSEGLVFSMFPNVGYDAGKTAVKPAFGVASKWVMDTIGFFADHPEHTLIVKVHPGELHREALDPMADQIRRAFPELPPNVRVLDPKTPATAQSVVRLADVCLIYTSTVAVESVGLGKPTIMTGGGRHAKHGATIDIDSADQFWSIMNDAVSTGKPPASDPEVGRRYAYSIFFRADMPITHFRMFDIGVARLNMTSWADMAPGGDPSLDRMCRAMLLDEEFSGEGLSA